MAKKRVSRSTARPSTKDTRVSDQTPRSHAPAVATHSSPSVGWEYWLAYFFLLHIRLLLTLASTGYIHPDEYFQNGEPLVGDLFDLPTERTWEFNGTTPCRSMAGLRLFNLPLILLAKLYRTAHRIPTARTLWLTQRLTAFGTTLLVDLCLPYLIPRGRTGEKDDRRVMQARLLFASSGATLVFSIRPLSNVTEAALLACCLAITVCLQQRRTVELDRHWHLLSTTLGALVALGLFSRFTFIIFVLPTGLAFLLATWKRVTVLPQGRTWKLISSLSLPCLGFSVVAAGHILYDTWYYRRNLSVAGALPAVSWPLIIVPWNALRYNLSVDNLSQHGLHPRWLHLAVNAPMMVGLPVWVASLVQLYRYVNSFGLADPQGTEEWPEKKLYLATLFLPLTLLSIQPHQEERFLLPLLIPALANLPLISSKTTKWWFRLFILTHLLQALLLVLFWDVLHHASLVPALLRINEEILHYSGMVPFSRMTLQALRAAAGDGGQFIGSGTGAGTGTGLWLEDLNSTASVAGVGIGGITIFVHVWYTLMPPSHLLLPASPRITSSSSSAQSSLPTIKLIDHRSRPSQEVLKAILDPISHQDPLQDPVGNEEEEEPPLPLQETTYHLLLSPTWALQLLSEELSSSSSTTNTNTSTDTNKKDDVPHVKLEILDFLSPHVDTDHISQSFHFLSSSSSSSSSSSKGSSQEKEEEGKDERGKTRSLPWTWTLPWTWSWSWSWPWDSFRTTSQQVQQFSLRQSLQLQLPFSVSFAFGLGLAVVRIG